jgi:hypothetical protein
MTLSTITNYSSIINENFPVPGVDNDTAVFRTNFQSIKNAFTATANEINSISIFNSAYTATITTNVINSVWSTVTNYLSTSCSYTNFTPASSKGQRGDIKGMVYATNASVYVCYSTWSGNNADIWAKVNTVSASW